MRHFAFIALLLSVLLTNTACSTIADELPSYAKTSVVNIGDKAPNFAIESIDGQLLTMPNGETTLLILFSHTCPDCRNMMSDLQTYLNNNDFEGRIIAISRGGTHSEIASFRDELGITFAIAADEQAEIYYKYATMYVPRCYVIDGEGTIRHITYEYKSGDVDFLMEKLSNTK